MQQQEWKRPSNPLSALMYDLNQAVTKAAKPKARDAEVPNKANRRYGLGSARSGAVIDAIRELKALGLRTGVAEICARMRGNGCDGSDESTRSMLADMADDGYITRVVTPAQPKKGNVRATRRQITFDTLD